MNGRVRVAVTGIGLISAIGRGVKASIDSVTRGAIGVGPIRGFEATGFSCRIAAEAGDIGEEFAPYDRFARFALIAATEAAASASLGDAGYASERIGTIVGTGLGGSGTLDGGYERLYSKRQSRMPPFMIPRAMYNAATSAVSSELGATGPAFGIVSACASGTHAIGEAATWIRSGLADAVVAGGADAPIVPGIVRAWEGLRVLAHDRDGAKAACRPFSADRSGLVLGEGAGIVVLERIDLALKRGATILGEISGVGLSSDAGHVTDPSVEGPTRAIRAALTDARLERADVGYVNAHGTATRANDPVETQAIRAAFGSAADSIPVSSTKAMHGHAMGASGAIELALSLAALNARIIPPTMNWRERDPECDLDYVPNEAREAKIETFVSNSFGFGGLNAVLVVRTIHAL